jgi:hypothetical protein
MSSGVVDSTAAGHPLERLVAELETLKSDLGPEPRAWTLGPSALADLLSRLSVVENWLTAVRLQLLREADRLQVGDPVGAGSTAGWWAAATRTTKPEAHRAVALAERLDDDRHAATAEAMVSGDVSLDQASVILHAVEALPTELVDAELRSRVEDHLVALAQHHDPKELRILGRKILDVLAPELAEQHERSLLESEERDAIATASFTMRPDGCGSVRGRFKIPVLAGEMLSKHLQAIAAPRHQAAQKATAEATAERVARPLRLGRAFTEYVETRNPDDAPKAGGIAASVVVTMTLENLMGTSERAALLDTGGSISASEARRLACEAGMIPAVLGSVSQPLDLGRRSRFHTGPQRIALGLRDGGCRAEHCDWPPGMCHAHHPTPWSRGGGTSLTNGMLLCPRHHTLAHDARYQLKAGTNGRVLFSRRT